MKTFASALLASSVLGAQSIIDFTMEGSYFLTRDPTTKFDVRSKSIDGGADDTGAAKADFETDGSLYGAIKYTYKLETTLATHKFKSVTTMLITNAKRVTAGGDTDIGFDMYMCFKNGAANSSGATD